MSSVLEKFEKSNSKIFREINYLVTSLVRPLVSRNFCQNCARENSRKFHTVKRTPFLLRKLHLGMNGKIWICSLNYWRSERSQGHVHTLCTLYKVPISFVSVNLEFMCCCFAYLISNQGLYDEHQAHIKIRRICT